MIDEETPADAGHLIDLTKELSPEDLKEFIALADNDSKENYISLSEYRKATEKWRVQ